MAIPDGWVKFVEVSNTTEAAILGGFLQQNEVPAILVSSEELPGLTKSVVVAVPRDLLHRAQWLTANQSFTDGELSFLATGKLPESGTEQ